MRRKFRNLKLSLPTLTALVLLLLCTSLCVYLMQGFRAFSRGESLWSESEKQVHTDLVQFTYSRDPLLLVDAAKHLTVLQGDREARRQLDAGQPNLQIVTEGFIRGGNDPKVIPSAILDYRLLGRTNSMSRALNAWRETDTSVDELSGFLTELSALNKAESLEDRAMNIRRRLVNIDGETTRRRLMFSETMNRESSRAESSLLIIGVVAGVVLMFMAGFVSQRFFRRLRRAELRDLAQQKANDELEGRVRHRTADLEKEIKDRKKVELELRWKTAFLVAQGDATIDGILVVDCNSKKIFQNKQFLKLWNVPRHIAEDPCDATQVNYVMGLTKDPERFLKLVVSLYDHPDQTSRDEIELRGGTVLDRYSAPVLGNDGQRYGRIWAFRDITEHRRNEDALRIAKEAAEVAIIALRSSEAHYRTVFETSADGIAVSQLSDGKYIDVNKAFLDLMGFERKEVVGRTSVELNFWADLGFRQELVAELREHSSFRDRLTQYVKKNGELIWVMISASAIEIEGVSCGVAVIRDVTAAKAAEERLAAAQHAQQASEARYRIAFQTSPDSVNINRLSDGMYIDCNKAFLETVGYKREEVLGKTSLELNIWANHGDRDELVGILRGSSSCRSLEAQFKKKSGEVFWGQMSASVIEIDGVPCVLSTTRDISEAKSAENQIKHLAFYDTLTRLPNRRMVSERLRQTLAASARSKLKGALLFVDLDNFKTLNDTLGHTTGDLLLQEVARRLTVCVRDRDTVARLGGDEFVVILEILGETTKEAAAHAESVAGEILIAVRLPYMLSGHECFNTCSIGVTVFGDQTDSIDDVLRQADIAMYQAKAAGRNTSRFFDPALQTAINARASMGEDLRQAIGTSQFQLYYQPQVEFGALIGAEALLRWNHPVHGLIPPSDFIPMAEETGLILPLGDWVLATACAQISAWAARKETSQLSIAVNISARQLRQPDFVDQVLNVLHRTGADPENLKLELTESMLVDNVEEVIEKMTDLKSHGMRFSLDDFGTGYSSLSYLRRLPLDQLKIDRAFVRDILLDVTSGAIAQSVISLSKAMSMSVIAEGVETLEQRDFLASLGCHSYQGYLFSPALPLKNFEVWLAAFAEDTASTAH